MAIMGILSTVNQLPQLTPCGSIWINPSQCHHFSLWLLRFFAFLRLLFFNVRHLSKRLQETISKAIWGRRMPRCIGSSCILNLLNQIQLSGSTGSSKRSQSILCKVISFFERCRQFKSAISMPFPGPFSREK